jgi:hypothetical protein
MKKSLFILMLLLLMSRAFSAKVDVETAQTAAINFFINLHNKNLNHPATSKQIEGIIVERSGEEDLIYIFNFQGSGYVMVSADDAAYPILGYSLDENYEPDNLPCCCRAWMDRYKSQIIFVKEHNIKADLKIKQAWERLLTDSDTDQLPMNMVGRGPWTDHIVWGQGFPYNAHCPADNTLFDPDLYYHCATGCGAMALGILMFHWRHPIQGAGDHNYVDPKYGAQQANFGAATYDWNGMTFDIQEECNAVSQLLYHAAVALETEFGAQSLTDRDNLRNALVSYFKFTPDIAEFTPDIEDFEEKLMNDLYDIPVLFSSFIENKIGHIWVGDGYRFDNTLPPDEQILYYHMNWGWYGSYNDSTYYALNAFEPDTFQFNDNLVALMRITPLANSDHYVCSGQTEITGNFGSIEDGSGPAQGQNGNYYYTGGKDCKWLIKPFDRVDNISLNFHDLSLNQNDRVKIYDGETASANLLWSGFKNPPAEIKSTGDKMLIHFIAQSDSPGGEGFLASFSTTPVPYCPQGGDAFELNTLTPSIDLASNDPEKLYRNDTYCTWDFIKMQEGTITFSLNYFYAADNNDKLIITDGNNLKIDITKDNWAQNNNIVTQDDDFKIEFNTDSLLRGVGWEGTVFFSPLQISENKLFRNVNVFPNPAVERMNIEISLYEPGCVEISLCSIRGQLIFKDDQEIKSGTFSRAYDVKNIPKGVYILQFKGQTGLMSEKVVIM